VRHFGSLQALQRASFRELRQFLTARQAEAVMAGVSMSSIVDTEKALAGPLNTPEAVYAANREMRWLRQEVVRVLLLNAHYFCVTREENDIAQEAQRWKSQSVRGDKSPCDWLL
jgi:DNA repair protein RadC